MCSWPVITTATTLGLLAAAAAVGQPVAGGAPAVSAVAPRGWSAYGGDAGQRRYSSLSQINRDNVGQLQVAWIYDAGEAGGLQTNPVVVDGVLYSTTPTHRVIALDAATGALSWTFKSGIEGRGPNRGVTVADGRVYTAQGPYLYALDTITGQPLASFGTDGRIDLRDGLGRDPRSQSVVLTTPGVIAGDLIIVGGRVSETLPAAPGDIRAFDRRTGALRWSFHTIPHPGEFGAETWPAEAWSYSGGANNWAGMALDTARNIVYVPTGSAASDFYGANRVGQNLFANSLLALDAATGRRLWHFQAVHHDIWDRDFPSPPSLVTVSRDGRRIDAVVQATKHGVLLLFDRVTGAPVFPIEERPFPPSTVDGEQASPTQPMPTRPVPFARQRLTEDMLTTRTPAAHQAALDAFRGFRSDGPFVPLAVDRPTVVFPGFDGGAEWGGSAIDVENGWLFVNANEMAWTGGLALAEGGSSGRQQYLAQCAGCHRDDRGGAPPQTPALTDVFARRSREQIARVVRDGAGRMPAFASLSPDALTAILEFVRTGTDTPVAPATNVGGGPADPTRLKYRFTGYRKFLDADGYPAIAPPWGTLNAIDLNTGELAWRVPLGEYPELAAAGVATTGSENYGGPVVTAGGLVFIAATNFDRKFRAFDKQTGALLWQTTLPYAGNGTPATYDVNGRQFVVVPAGGGKSRPLPAHADQPVTSDSGGVYVAYALPMRKP